MQVAMYSLTVHWELVVMEGHQVIWVFAANGFPLLLTPHDANGRFGVLEDPDPKFPELIEDLGGIERQIRSRSFRVTRRFATHRNLVHGQNIVSSSDEFSFETSASVAVVTSLTIRGRVSAESGIVKERDEKCIKSACGTDEVLCWYTVVAQPYA